MPNVVGQESFRTYAHAIICCDTALIGYCVIFALKIEKINTEVIHVFVKDSSTMEQAFRVPGVFNSLEATHSCTLNNWAQLWGLA